MISPVQPQPERLEAAIFNDLLCMEDAIPRDAALNMAIDEALFANLIGNTGETRPLLRIYRWNESAVSIGYFERFADARELFPVPTLVRRWTGGGIVEHGRDLTYSLLIPRQRAPGWWQGSNAYRDIHAGVVAALKSAGVEGASLAGDASVPANDVSRECFRKPVSYDVLIGERKIAGAAQRRTRAGLLHQGSIQGRDEHNRRLPLAPGETLHAAVAAQLRAAFGRRLEFHELSPQVLEDAKRLAAARYGTREWLEKF